jgi:hypothetical protein
VEEYLAYDQYRLSIKFALIMSEDESEAQFLVKVELEAENVVGSYSRAEHDACIKSLPNGSCLNRVFEMAGIAYGRRPQPGTEASSEASKKRKVDSYSQTAGRHAMVPAKKETIPLKISVPKVKAGLKRPSDVELALAKPVKNTREFALASSAVFASGRWWCRGFVVSVPGCCRDEGFDA